MLSAALLHDTVLFDEVDAVAAMASIFSGTTVPFLCLPVAEDNFLQSFPFRVFTRFVD